MARADLSDNAPMLAVTVTGGRGVHVATRPVAGPALQDEGPGTTAGLLPAQRVLRAASGAGNLLVQPVWFKLSRHDGTWQAFVSLDGTTWLPAGTPAQPLMAGCWVGLFATPRSPSGTVTAVFDRLAGWRPSRAVELGAG